MDMNIIFTAIGTVIAIVSFVYAIMRNFKNDINSHIDRLDGGLKLSNEKIDLTNKRIDHLYHISVELLRERKKEI